MVVSFRFEPIFAVIDWIVNQEDLTELAKILIYLTALKIQITEKEYNLCTG